MIEELIKQLEDLEIKNDNLTNKINMDLATKLEDLTKINVDLTNQLDHLTNKINMDLTNQLEDLTKINMDLTNQLEDITKIDNKPSINWTKNKLITFCKNNNISGYSNCNKTKLLELIHSKQPSVKGQLCSINGNNYEKKNT